MEKSESVQPLRAVVTLEEPSVAKAGHSLRRAAESEEARAYRERLEARQGEVIAAMEAALGRAVTVRRRMTLLSNTFTAELRPAELAAVEALAGVKSVKPEHRAELPPRPRRRREER